MPRIKIDAEKCKGCGYCVLYCRKGLIGEDKRLNEKGYRPARYKGKKNECTGCMMCAIICPECAIEVYK
jgi:2-oxoglutarate ferredoxin oxidoreductase subunit delta